MLAETKDIMNRDRVWCESCFVAVCDYLQYVQALEVRTYTLIGRAPYSTYCTVGKCEAHSERAQLRVLMSCLLPEL